MEVLLLVVVVVVDDDDDDDDEVFLAWLNLPESLLGIPVTGGVRDLATFEAQQDVCH